MRIRARVAAVVTVAVSLPPPPSHRYVVVHGGYSHGRGDGGFLGDTYVLDTQSDPMVWSQPALSGNAPTARHGHSAAVINGELFFFGGSTRAGLVADVHILQLPEEYTMD